MTIIEGIVDENGNTLSTIADQENRLDIEQKKQNIEGTAEEIKAKTGVDPTTSGDKGN